MHELYVHVKELLTEVTVHLQQAYYVSPAFCVTTVALITIIITNRIEAVVIIVLFGLKATFKHLNENQNNFAELKTVI